MRIQPFIFKKKVEVFFCNFIVKFVFFYQMCLFFRFQLVPRTQEGKVFPPLLMVTYRDIPISDSNSEIVSVSRAHTYMFVFI